MKHLSTLLTAMTLLAACCTPVRLHAKEQPSQPAPVYSPAAHMYVCGDVDSITASDKAGRFVIVPVKTDCTLPAPADKRNFSNEQIQNTIACLESNGVARQMLDYQKSHMQAMSESERAAMLEHNYIFLVQRIPHRIVRHSAENGQEVADSIFYTAFMVFRVQDEPSAPRPVCIKSGVFGSNTNFMDYMEAKVPDFAPAATITSKKPLTINDDYSHGFRSGELVSIHDTHSSDGRLVSERIGYARIGHVNDNGCTLIPLAGRVSSWQPGDVAVHRGNKRNALSLEATWMPHNWGGAIGYSYLCGQNASGLSARLLVEAGFSSSDIDTKKRYYVQVPAGAVGGSFHAPVHQFYGHIGMGMPIPVKSYLEIMPQLMLGYSYVRTDCYSSLGNFNAHYFRIPVGVTFATNISYPLQFLLTAGYAFNIGFNLSDMAKAANEDYGVVNAVCEKMGVNIDGFYLKAGVRWNF